MNTLRSSERNFLYRSLFIFSMIVLPMIHDQPTLAENVEGNPTRTASLLLPEFRNDLVERTGTVVADRANVRRTAKLSGAIMTTLKRNDTVTILSRTKGDLVTSSGITSDEWFHIQLPNGEYGYIWAPLVNETTTPDESSIVSEKILQHCQFVPEMIFVYLNNNPQQGGHEVRVTPEEVLSKFGEISGRNIWLGYKEQVPEGAPSGFDMPDDVQELATVRFRIGDDRQELRFLYSGSTQQVFVLPFDSFAVFADANGNHFGFHPCGAYEISVDEFFAVLDWILVDPPQSCGELQQQGSTYCPLITSGAHLHALSAHKPR